MSRTFASDNYSGAHPEILRAITEASSDHAPAYGYDRWTEAAERKFKELLGESTEVFFVFNGTAANVLGLKALLQSHEAVLCAEKAHINVDECGAPERFLGCKLITVPAEDCKLSVASIEARIHGVGVEHHVQPKVISLSQSTEYGTVYRFEEIRSLADFAHSRGMYLHVDGARIGNAAASLGASLRRITAEAGVDIMSFGGGKNGLLFGEAVVFFRPELTKSFKFIRKQGMQLASKHRFISAQFSALLSNDLWLRNASHANRMARLLAEEAAKIPGISLTQKVEANAVFAKVPKEQIPRLQEKFSFYVWDEHRSEVRWMTSFDTTEQDVRDFAGWIRTTAQ